MTQKRKNKLRIDTNTQQPSTQTTQPLFLNIVKQRIAAGVFDQKLACEFYQTYGPFNTQQLKTCLDTLLCSQPKNVHLSFYLNHIKNRLIGE